MRAYGRDILAAAEKARHDATLEGRNPFDPEPAIIAALRHMLNPSKKMREALLSTDRTEGRFNLWRAGIKAAIKELEG